jgi:hypothetical protein
MIRGPRSVLVLAVLALLSAAPVAADPVDLYGRQIEFFLPVGYCYLDESQQAEKMIVDNIVQMNQGSNELIAYFAPCNDLVAYRSGAIATLSEYGIVFVPLVEGSFQASPSSRAESLPQIAATMPALDEALLSQIEQEVNQNQGGFTLSGTQFLGLIGQDANALYAGMVAEVSDGQTSVPAAGVLAITQLQDVVMTINLSRTYRSNADIVALLTEAQTYAAELVAANP